jgi:hypothetical protein
VAMKKRTQAQEKTSAAFPSYLRCNIQLVYCVLEKLPGFARDPSLAPGPTGRLRHQSLYNLVKYQLCRSLHLAFYKERHTDTQKVPNIVKDYSASGVRDTLKTKKACPISCCRIWT